MSDPLTLSSSTTTQTPPPDPSGNSQPPGAPPSLPSGWWDSFKDPDVKGFVANKKYEDPEMLASAYRSLERLMGADKAGRTVVLPKDDNDADGMKAFRAKLGVPESPDGYKLPLPDGADDGFAKAAAKWMHEAGIPAKSAEKVAAAWNSWVAEQVKAGQEADKLAAEQRLGELRAQWGDKYDTNVELAQRGLKATAQAAGLEESDLDKLKASIGLDKTLKLFQQIGNVTGEGGFAGGSGGTGQFSMSPGQAQERINQITADRMSGKINDYTWRTQYDGDEGEMARLIRIVTGGQKAA